MREADRTSTMLRRRHCTTIIAQLAAVALSLDSSTLVARSTGVPVILDVGEIDALFPQELLNFIDILSPNESKLGRLTGMTTESFEQITQARSFMSKNDKLRRQRPLNFFDNYLSQF